MTPITKLLIVSGLILIALGIFWQFGGRFLPLGRLPGDIRIERENFRFYFPVVTSVLLSMIVSAILYLIRYFKER